MPKKLNGKKFSSKKSLPETYSGDKNAVATTQRKRRLQCKTFSQIFSLSQQNSLHCSPARVEWKLENAISNDLLQLQGLFSQKATKNINFLAFFLRKSLGIDKLKCNGAAEIFLAKSGSFCPKSEKKQKNSKYFKKTAKDLLESGRNQFWKPCL